MILHRLLKRILAPVFRLELAFAIALAGILAFELVQARNEQRELAAEVLRLHVVANSDSPEDQALKLKVRDRILAEYEGDLKSFYSQEEAEDFVFSELENIERLAESVLREESAPCGVRVVLDDEMFPQRKYGDVVLPAGEYRALRVVIGEGAGENWWCVMFPPMCCFAEADSGEVFGEEWPIATEDNVEIRFRLRILEVFRNFRLIRD